MSLLVNLFPIRPRLLLTGIATGPCYNKMYERQHGDSSELHIRKKTSLDAYAVTIHRTTPVDISHLSLLHNAPWQSGYRVSLLPQRHGSHLLDLEKALPPQPSCERHRTPPARCACQDTARVRAGQLGATQPQHPARGSPTAALPAQQPRNSGRGP